MPIIRVPIGGATKAAPKVKVPVRAVSPRVQAPTVETRVPTKASSPVIVSTPAATRNEYAPPVKEIKAQTNATKVIVPKANTKGYASVAAATPKTGIFGSIMHDLGDVGKTAGTVAVRAVKDIPYIAKQTGVSLENGGIAAVKTLESPRDDIKTAEDAIDPADLIHDVSHNATPIDKVVNQSLTPYEQLAGARGGYKAIGHEFAQHPLAMALTYAPLVHLPGDVAGAAMRTGALGTRAAEIASTGGRAADEIADGVTGPKRTYSKNIMAKGVQQRIDADDRLSQLNRTRHAIRPRTVIAKIAHNAPVSQLAVTARMHDIVDHIVGANLTHNLNSEDRLDRTLADSYKSTAGRSNRFTSQARDIRDNIGHVVNGEMATPATAHDDLARLAVRYDKTASDYEHEIPGHVNEADYKEAVKNRGSAMRLLSRPPDKFHETVAKMFELKPKIVDQSSRLAEQAARMNLLERDQIARRSVLTYAQHQMGGRDAITDGPVENQDFVPQHYAHPAAVQAVKDANKELLAAKLDVAKAGGISGRGSRLAADSTARDAMTRFHRADKAEAAAFKGYTEKNGMIKRYRTVSGKRPSTVSEDAAKLNAAQIRSDAARAEAERARQIQVEEQAATRQNAADRLTVAKQRHGDAVRTEAALRDFRGKHLQGWVSDVDPVTGEAHLDGHARQLSTDAIVQHMERHGVSPTGYIHAGHSAATEMARPDTINYGLNTKRYTGRSTETGAWDPTLEGVHKSMRRQLRAVEHNQGMNNLIRTTNVRRGMALEEAKAFKPEWEADHPGQKLRLVAEKHVGLDDDAAQRLQEAHGTPNEAATYNKELLSARMIQPSNEAAHAENSIAALPESAVKRYEAHMKAENPGGPERVARSLNRVFKMSVLPTSTKWPFEVLGETGIRSAFAGHGIHDVQFGHQVFNSLDDEARDNLAAHMGYGQLAGQMRESSREALRPTQDPGMRLAAKHMVSKMIKPYTVYANGVFKLMHAVEREGQMGALGSHAHMQIREMATDWHKTIGKQTDYLKALGDGYATDAQAEDLSRYIHTTLGKYNSFSPAMKRYVQGLAPFAPWAMNAMKFIGYTMPKDHPYAQAALLGNTAAQNELNKTQPYATNFLGTKLGDLTTAYKHGGNKYTDFLRDTPWSVFTENKSPLDSFLSTAGAVGGQQVAEGLGGTNSFDEHQKFANGTEVSPGSLESWMFAGNDLLGSLLGPVDKLQTILQGGATGEPDDLLLHHPLSTKTNSGKSLLKGVGRAVNPFRATVVGARTAKVGGSNYSGGSNYDGSTNYSGGSNYK